MTNFQDNKILEIDARRKFQFKCASSLPCFKKCCLKTELPITPWDAACLQKKLEMTGKEFCDKYLIFSFCPKSGLPQALLKMLPDYGNPCPFLVESGCSVYDCRPGACRFFPFGRSSRIGRHGIESRFWTIRETFCEGWKNDRKLNIQEWLNNQMTKNHIHFNDRYMLLASMIAASGKSVDNKFRNLSKAALYYQDEFTKYLLDTRKNIFIQKNMDYDRKMILDLTFDWLEILIFGKTVFSDFKDINHE